MSNQNGPVFTAVRSFFEKDEWRFEAHDTEPYLRMSFAGDDGTWTCIAQAREEDQQFLFYSVAPLKVPVERRLAAAEFIARANYGMIIGNFELDFSDGEIRYKTSVDVEGSELNHELVKRLVYPNVLTMDRYLKGLLKLAFGNLSAAEAVAFVEDPQPAAEAAAPAEAAPEFDMSLMSKDIYSEDS